MKRALLILMVFFFATVALVSGAEYKAQLIPWIVGDGGWWAGVNLKNESGYETDVQVSTYDLQGGVLDNYDISLLPYESYQWMVPPGVRSIKFEGSDSIFITAHQGRGGSFTELQVREIVSLKN